MGVGDTYRERARGINVRRSNASVDILLIREVLVHNVDALLIVLMLLEVVDGGHAASLLNVECVLVGGAGATAAHQTR